jgi:beta-glucosidase
MTVRQVDPSDVEAPAYLDPDRSTQERVGDLLARMTSDEKLAQLGAVWAFDLVEGSALSADKARECLSDGIGQVTRPGGATNLPPVDAARFANEIQRYLVERTRLGIPAIFHEECLHGVMARGAPDYPQSIGQAATWDPELIERSARLVGERLSAGGISQGLAPILDVARDPRWGRIEETYGEDPYLIGALACAYIRGMQGPRPNGRPVLATGKHMVGHGVPEGGRNTGPAHLGRRELADAFLWPFEAAVRGTGLGSMMHAYDDLDGVPCVASHELFTTILRDRWGFEGMVVSDYLGITHLVTLHRMADDLADAAGMALHAGVDVELPATDAYGAPLRAALKSGRIDPVLVDRAVERVLRAKFELGLFERPYVDPAKADATAAAERTVALELARRSIVLLENDGVLPLRGDLRSVAVIGPNADSARNLLGDYAHVTHIETLLEARGRAGVAGIAGPVDLELMDELAGRPTILSAIRARLTPGAEVRYARGCGILDGDDAGIAAAVEAARGADVAIMVLGEKSGLTADCTCGEFRDRMDIGLPGRQRELFDAVAALGVPIVLVLVAGRPLAIPDEAARAAAVLHAWVPGEAGPTAIADALTGAVDPGGKLPVTVPRHVGQVPTYYGHRPSGGRSIPRGDYVDGSHLPLWPFGFGRSYTRFELDALTLDRDRLGPDDELVVRISCANIGDRAGDEVVQLYVRDLAASVSRPVNQLLGFRRVHLPPGERCTIRFTLAAEQLAFTGVDGDLIIEPGRHQVMVGTSSADLPCVGEFEVVGEARSIGDRSRFFTMVDVEAPRGKDLRPGRT